MTPSSKQENPESAFVVGRRSARLSMIIPVTIHGMDRNGQSFRENTWTIGINKQGAKIATFHPLLPGVQISVVNPVLGRTAKARVVWVGDKRFPEDPYEVGVELTEAQNVWGIKFPPEDWQRPPAGGHGPEGPAEAAPSTQGTKPENSELKPAEAGKPGESSGAATPEKFNQFNMAVAALSHFAQQSEVKGGGRPEVLEPPPARPALGGEEVRSAVQYAQHLLERLTEKERSLRSLEEQLAAHARGLETSRRENEALLAKIQEAQRGPERSAEAAPDDADRLEASRERLEALLAKIDEIERGWQDQIERARASVEGASAQALGSAMESSIRLLTGQLTESLDRHAQAASQRFERAFQENLEKFRQQIEQEASSAALKVHERCQTEAEGTIKVITNRVDWAVESLNLATGSAAAKLYAAYRKAEGDFKSLKTDYPQRLADLSSAGLESFRQKTQALSADFGRLLQDTWSEYQQKSAKHLAEQLERSSEDLLESWARQLQKKADDLLEMMTGQLKNSGTQILEEVTKQLASTGESMRDALTGEAKTSLQDVRALGEKLGASGKALVDQTANQLSAMTRATLESLTKEAQAIIEEGRAQARRSLQEFQDRGPRELESQLQTALEKHREAIQKELQKEARDSGERALTEIRSRSQQVVQEASEAVYKQVGMGAVVLKDWADQARSHLDGFLQKSLEAFQKRLSEVSDATLEKHRTGSESFAEDLRARLQQAARIFHEKGQEPTEPSAQQGAENAAPLPSQAGDRNESEPDDTLEQWKKRQEQAVNDAAEAFRRKLADMLAGFQSGRKETGEGSAN